MEKIKKEKRMSIPNYEKFMNPVLQAFAEQKEPKRKSSVAERIYDIIGLSKEEREILTPTKTEPLANSRSYWAMYYLYRAGLLAKESKGYYRITDEGKKILTSGQKLNTEYLKQHYPSLNKWISLKSSISKDSKENSNKPQIEITNIDPETMLNNAMMTLNNKLDSDILDALKSVRPQKFEEIVLELMEVMDYGKGTTTQYVCDGGIDGIINEDELGLSKIYLQAKRYTPNSVNEREMRDFIGALAEHNVMKGVFITTSVFSEKAKKAAQNPHGHVIRLIDGYELSKLMRLHNLGAKHKKNYDIKEIDNSYFEEGEE